MFRKTWTEIKYRLDVLRASREGHFKVVSHGRLYFTVENAVYHMVSSSSAGY
jgi:hypothetical protein